MLTSQNLMKKDKRKILTCQQLIRIIKILNSSKSRGENDILDFPFVSLFALRGLLNTGRFYLAPIPCLISPVIFPMTSAAPPTIFLATSPVLFNNDPPASVIFFPTADMVELAD